MHRKPLTHLSLFSGIGGIDLAAERAGFTAVAFVEKDPFCCEVLAKHWPGVPIVKEIKSFDARSFRGRIDLLSGGFPCQDVSDAGKRVGIGGERSGLWSEMFRCICEIRPRFVLVENVAGLLRRGMGRVLGDLASIGFDAEWSCVQAAAVGAHHSRERLFILAYPHDERHSDYQPIIAKLFSDGAECIATESKWHLAKPQIAPNHPAWMGRVPDSSVCRMVAGVPDRMDRYSALGNAVNPGQVLPILAAIAQDLRQREAA